MCSSPNHWLPVTISLDAEFPVSVVAADLDQDGDLDVLSASAGDDTIAWYENTDGQGTFGLQKIINDQANLATAVYAADFDQDGDFDVLSGSSGDGSIAWYENDGAGNFGSPQALTNNAKTTYYVIAADLDGDDDLDVIATAGEGDKISWFENLSPLYKYFPIIGNSE